MARKTSPSRPVGWVQIHRDHIDEALAVLGLPRALADGAGEYTRIPTSYGDAVHWITAGEDHGECLQVYASAVTRWSMAQLAALAEQINCHADFPAWAGWKAERDVSPADAYTANDVEITSGI